MKSADSGVAELEANVDSLIVILNDKLLDVLGDDITQDQAFGHVEHHRRKGGRSATHRTAAGFSAAPAAPPPPSRADRRGCAPR